MKKNPDKNTLRVPLQWRDRYQDLLTLRKSLSGRRDRLAPRGSSSLTGQSMSLGILAHEADALSEVDAAIVRILDGSYGICQKTGMPIPESRLRVVPWTRFTKEALEEIERGEMAERLPWTSVAWLAPA